MLDEKGIRLYAELLRIGHQDLMASVFPGCASLIGDQWPQTVDDYLEHYPPDHYNLNRAAQRFPQYLAAFGERFLRRYPFLVELADYEWLELELIEHPGVVMTCPHQPLASPEQFERWRPVVNPVLVVRRYRYPITGIVEQLAEGLALPDDLAPAPATVIVYRDPDNDCRFLEVTEMTCRTVELARSGRHSYKDLIASALSEIHGADPQECVVEFMEMVEKLQSLKLFVGSLPL